MLIIERSNIWDKVRRMTMYLIFFNVYLLLRERERERVRQSVSGGRAEREGDTESEAGSRL